MRRTNTTNQNQQVSTLPDSSGDALTAILLGEDSASELEKSAVTKLAESGESVRGGRFWTMVVGAATVVIDHRHQEANESECAMSQFSCPTCSSLLDLASSKEGKVRCTKCEVWIRVPGETPANPLSAPEQVNFDLLEDFPITETKVDVGGMGFAHQSVGRLRRLSHQKNGFPMRLAGSLEPSHF